MAILHTDTFCKPPLAIRANAQKNHLRAPSLLELRCEFFFLFYSRNSCMYCHSNNVAASWFYSPERGLAASNPCRFFLPMALIIFGFHRM
jgi:hypothetical protein